MYPARCRVVKASSLDEAVDLLQAHPEAELLAGGQSLIPLMKSRLAAPDVVIDIGSAAPEVPISVGDDRATVHALATHAQLGDHGPLTSTFGLVDDVVPQIADAQVRNMGTIGGSLAEADPGNDWGPVVMATDGVVRTRGTDGSREIPVDEFIHDPFTTALEAGELIEGVDLPVPDGRSGSVYVKSKRRQGGYGVASVAVQLGLDGTGACEDVRVAVADGVSAYVRPTAAEDRLVGHPIDEARLDDAGQVVREAVDPIEDTTGSVAYKRELCGVLFEHAVRVAESRARGEPATVDPVLAKGVVT